MSYQTYKHPDGAYTVSVDGVWFPGIYDSRATAARITMHMTREEVDKEFGHIFSFSGWDRPITEADYTEYLERKAEVEPEITAEEKLAKIEELMHPGFWSAYDYRREAILKALGSERSSWSKEPEEYAGH